MKQPVVSLHAVKFRHKTFIFGTTPYRDLPWLKIASGIQMT
jgi:hypothetical protein